jgi:hypothetical protein
VIVSLFTSNYVMRWAEHLPDTPLRTAPAFDARAVRLLSFCSGSHARFIHCLTRLRRVRLLRPGVLPERRFAA